MGKGRPHFRLPALLAALLAFLCLAPSAQAQDKVNDACHVASSLDEPIAAAIADRSRWTCGDPGKDLSAERSLLVFDLALAESQPTHLVIRRASLGALHLTLLERDGSLRTTTHGLDDFSTAGIEGMIGIELPQLGAETTHVVATFDRPTTPSQLRDSQLVTGDPQLWRETQRGRIIAAIICGMLLMPMVFNLAFWRILREKFLIWHILSAGTMICSILFTSGLISWLTGVSMSVVNFGGSAFFGVMVGAATMFAYHFIEPGKVHPEIRKLLPWAAGLAAALSILHACFPFVMREYQLSLYMFGFLPVLAVQIAMMASALKRGSRAARYQALGWGPLLLVGVIRQVSYLTPSLDQTDAMALFYFGCAFEVFATAMGVADRLMLLKRQRDMARDEVRELEDLSQRDALTGLLNRRAIQRRFDTLRKQGFTTMAVLDLDKFKDINDTYGHARGDEVLTVVAEALQEDKDTIPVRMGGEEFLLLLRGADAAGRAEMRRLAITAKIAQGVLLDRRVTCSMGLVEAPGGSVHFLDFDALYERADKLLYEAKATGRNRTVSERLQLFEARPAAA